MTEATLDECNSAHALIAQGLRTLAAESAQTEAERIARHHRFMELMQQHKQVNELWRNAFTKQYGSDFSSLATKSPLVVKRECLR